MPRHAGTWKQFEQDKLKRRARRIELTVGRGKQAVQKRYSARPSESRSTMLTGSAQPDIMSPVEMQLQIKSLQHQLDNHATLLHEHGKSLQRLDLEAERHESRIGRLIPWVTAIDARTSRRGLFGRKPRTEVK